MTGVTCGDHSQEVAIFKPGMREFPMSLILGRKQDFHLIVAEGWLGELWLDKIDRSAGEPEAALFRILKGDCPVMAGGELFEIFFADFDNLDSGGADFIDGEF